MTRDVVVVGSGHNALVAACYLARAGLDVEVVEKDTVIGGAVSTVERWPGYAVDRGSSAHIMIRHTGIVEDLRLDECGLTYLDLDPWGFAPFGPPDDQQAITFSLSLDRTCESIAAVCGDRDAEAYRAFVTDWAARNEAVFAAFQDVPSAGRLGRHLWGAGKAADVGGLEMSRQFLQPGDQLLDEHFTDERLKTALAWLGAQSGPPMHEVATADLVGWSALLHTPSAGARRRRVRCPDGGAGRAAAPARRHAARRRRCGGDHPLRRPGHRRSHRLGRAHRGARRPGRLPRPHHAGAARRRGAARARHPGGARRQRSRHGRPARHDRPAPLPLDGRALGVRRPAAARAQPRPPPLGVRRLRRGPHPGASPRSSP